jgi:hypothetical protein
MHHHPRSAEEKQIELMTRLTMMQGVTRIIDAQKDAVFAAAKGGCVATIHAAQLANDARVSRAAADGIAMLVADTAQDHKRETNLLANQKRTEAEQAAAEKAHRRMTVRNGAVSSSVKLSIQRQNLRSATSEANCSALRQRALERAEERELEELEDFRAQRARKAKRQALKEALIDSLVLVPAERAAYRAAIIGSDS